MQDGNYLERVGVGTIDNQVGINREKLHVIVGQISSPVTSAGISETGRQFFRG
jgi:hypothetical protein